MSNVCDRYEYMFSKIQLCYFPVHKCTVLTVSVICKSIRSTTAELKEPQDLILSVGMGASFLDVAVVSPKNASPDTNPDVLSSPAPSASAKTAETVAAGGGKKKKKKGAGAGAGASAGKSGSMEYRVTASVGDPACGGLDMDYLVARALLVRLDCKNRMWEFCGERFRFWF